jgi:hypothetical protein
MPSFQQLLKGFAERVAKRQGELDELQKAASRRIHLEESANSMFTNPEIAPTDFKLYHGSPYKFDEFDFESNLLKGEGAMAFGPGGYMTGHDPLAREYARNLYDRHGRLATHLGIREALSTDPKATAEYLRAITVGHLLPWADKYGGKSFAALNTVGPRSRAAEKLVHLGVPLTYKKPYASWESKREFLGDRTIYADDFEPYAHEIRKAGLLPTTPKERRIGMGGISPLEAVMRAALEGSKARDARPKLREEFEPDYAAAVTGKPVSWSDVIAHNKAKFREPVGQPSGFNSRRRNLNSTARVIEGRPGSANYSASMSPNSLINLRDPKFATGDELARRLYTTGIDASFADMLPYDYPISTMTPEKIGALAQLAERYSFLDKLTPESRGYDVLNLLKSAGPPIKQIQALKEAGIPATFFLRRGKRNGLPDTIDPSDFNYIIHDQSRLGKPDVEEFRAGGAV